MFIFLFDSNKFKTLREDELKTISINLEIVLSFNNHLKLMILIYFLQLKVLKEILANEN